MPKCSENATSIAPPNIEKAKRFTPPYISTDTTSAAALGFKSFNSMVFPFFTNYQTQGILSRMNPFLYIRKMQYPEGPVISKLKFPFVVHIKLSFSIIIPLPYQA